MKRWWLLLAVLFLVGTGANAATTHHAGLVIRYGDGRVETYCVAFDEPSLTGVELLQRAGVTTIVDFTSSFGQAVCKIDGEGCDYPLEDCFCQCQNVGENCVYWAYYHLVDGQWQYSGEGAGTYQVHDGDVEGWAWGPGTAGSGTEPPVVTFDEICGTGTSPLPTPTPSPTVAPTATPERAFTPSPSPTASATPTPCTGAGCSQLPTPTPSPPRLLYTFTAAETSIYEGKCTSLMWDVQGASEVILRAPEGDIPLAARGERRVCPQQTTEYTLIMRQGSEEAQAVLTITVSPVIAPPTATPVTALPSATATPPLDITPTATATPRPPITPTPVERVVTLVVTPLPTSTPAKPSPTPAMALSPTVAVPPHALIVTPPRPLPYKLRRQRSTPTPTQTPRPTAKAGSSPSWFQGWRAYGVTLALFFLIALGVYVRRSA